MRKKLLLVLFLGLIFNSFSQMTGWSHSVPVTVTEHSGAPVTNYQLRLVVATDNLVSAGEMLSSGDDIRFMTSCTGGDSLHYWIESGMNTSNTIIWVKIDTLAASQSRTIYMQYGNAAASGISAIYGTFVGPHSATDSVSGGGAGGVTDSQRGMRFAANEDILVTSFGKNEPTGSARYITLFDNATQAILRQIQVSGPAAQYSYSSLASPIWLNQGQQYIIEMHQNSTDGYYFGSSSQIGQHLTYMDMRYCNGCDQNTFPVNYLNNIHYGYPDFWYYTKKQVSPAPTWTFESFTTGMADESSFCLADSTQLVLNILGGEAPYTIAWTGPVSDANALMPWASPADTTEFFVTVEDNCGVVRTDSITLNTMPLPDLAIVSSAPLICNGEFAELSVTDTSYNYLWFDNSDSTLVVVMPSVTTTYNVSATNNYGCTKVFEYEQVVNVPLTATHDIDICANEFHTVGNHTYNLSGTYTDTLTGLTNCDSIVTTNLNVHALPLVTYDRLICYGTSFSIGQHTYSVEGTYVDTISGSSCDSIVTTNLTIADDIDAQIQAIQLTLVADAGADTYAWVDCNNGNAVIPGATGSFYEVTANGSYASMVTIGNCSKISNCITVGTIGLEEPDRIDNISVFPNPNNGTFTVQSSVSQTIRIINTPGQVIETVTVTAGQPQVIELNGLRPGVYFLASRTKVVRIVVE